jgi:hypothetical protein
MKCLRSQKRNYGLVSSPQLLARVRVDTNVLKVYVQQVSRCRSFSSFVLTTLAVSIKLDFRMVMCDVTCHRSRRPGPRGVPFLIICFSLSLSLSLSLK